MMGGWLFFRETNPAYLFRFLRLSPFDSTAQERENAHYLHMSVLAWTVPLILEDEAAFWRESGPFSARANWTRPIPRLPPVTRTTFPSSPASLNMPFSP